MTIRVRDRDERAEVEDDVSIGDGVGYGVAVRQVSAEDLDAPESRFVNGVEPAVVVAGVVADECANERNITGETLDQVAKDEARGSRDEDATIPPKTRRALNVSHRG